MEYSLKQYHEASDYIKERIGCRPKIGLILGSGLGNALEMIENKIEIPYGEIPHFPESTVESHIGTLNYFTLEGKTVLAMSGRFHYYEGYEMAETAFPIIVMKLLGIRSIILTNAAGAVNTSYNVGDFMLIHDHIKMFSQSPVRGQGFLIFGRRFFDMCNTYTPEYRSLLKEIAEEQRVVLREGVYAYMPGPQFETPAEIRMLRTLGADAVGMSTVAEAITATGCQMKVAAVSCITNMGAGILKQEINDDEVVKAAGRARQDFQNLIFSFIKRMEEA